MWEHIGTIATIAGFTLNLVITAGGLIWKLSRVEAAIMAALAKERREIDDEFEKLRREVGEVATALRQKVHEVEVWSRDNFARRDSVYKVKDELLAGMQSFGDRIEVRLVRMEQKIDSRAE